MMKKENRGNCENPHLQPGERELGAFSVFVCMCFVAHKVWVMVIIG